MWKPAGWEEKPGKGFTIISKTRPFSGRKNILTMKGMKSMKLAFFMSFMRFMVKNLTAGMIPDDPI